MAHKGKWRKICGIQKSQDCYNCANKLEISETKNAITVTCNLDGLTRTIDFPRCRTPYCGGGVWN